MCLENPEIRGKSNKLIHLAAMTTNGKLLKKPMNFLCPRPPRIMDSALLPPSKFMWILFIG